jgi:hypothetical protein
MRALSSADCLELWERGFGLHPLDRGLLALAAALPETPYASLADWPLGRRNTSLIALHCASFGPNLQGQITCPLCAENLEFRMDGEALRKEEPERAECVVVNGRSFRLPTTRDLASAMGENDSRLAAIRVAESCRLKGEERIDWQDEDPEEIGERMAMADPMAEIRLAFDCARCGHQWEESLDPVAFLWMEIEGRAKRLLMEVHALATAYGWTESEILSLSELRRRLYLEMVHA